MAEPPIHVTCLRHTWRYPTIHLAAQPSCTHRHYLALASAAAATAAIFSAAVLGPMLSGARGSSTVGCRAGAAHTYGGGGFGEGRLQGKASEAMMEHGQRLDTVSGRFVR